MQVYGACMEASPEGIYYSRRRCWQQLGLRAMSCRLVLNRMIAQTEIVTTELAAGMSPPFCQDQAAEFLAQLKTAAREIGFSPMTVDPTIFRHTESEVIIGVHVDDFMITGGNEDAIERMKDLGEAENILGIRIQRHKGKLMIDQSQFAKEIVAEFLYDDSMKHATPMEPGAIRKLAEEPGPLNHDEWLKYVELLGKLIWLCNTRFDIIFAVNRMASFTVEACWNHWKALLRILGYVGRTIHHGITYGGNNEHAQGGTSGLLIVQTVYTDSAHWIVNACQKQLIVHYQCKPVALLGALGHVGSAGLQDGEAFSDTDYATDPRDRKSILGFVFMVYGGAVMTYSKKMKSVARSTTEAEYLPSGDVDYLQNWKERGANRVSNTSKIKHVDIAFHHVVDEVKEGESKSTGLCLGGFREEQEEDWNWTHTL
ncbi:reverse transcriptase (RNA-dependent DNA polymerase) [Hirsutella rhossiliensis]